MADIDPWKEGSRIRMSDAFVAGLKQFRKDDWEGALGFFRTADESADIDDIYQNRYTSFHGLVRVYLGDQNGVKLCRKAAVGERNDVEVYHNLALAESRLGFVEGACMALRRGLKIDAGHPGLKRLKEQLGLRGKHALNPNRAPAGVFRRVVGRLFRGRGTVPGAVRSRS